MPIDGSVIQSRVNKGMQIAAQRVGFPFDVYRPDDVMAPLNDLAHIATTSAVFDASMSYQFNVPNGYGKAVWTAIVDPDAVAVGDYLANPDQGTWFIAAKQPLLPILAVQCSDTLTLMRAAMPQTFGAIDYRVDVKATEAPLFKDWPASVLRGSSARQGGDGLPGQEPEVQFSIVMPAVAGVLPRQGDVLVTATGGRLSVVWFEATDLGWRMSGRRLAATA